MSVLTLRLAGPLQAWGASARFARRTTESAPTKSGVIGMLAAAQGMDRGDDQTLAQLALLRFAVRIDQPGTRVRDFQTAHHADTGKSMPLSERYYLADAAFVAAVEGDDSLLDELDAALHNPVHPPYLGRRSCPPAHPIRLGMHLGTDLTQALRAEPWQASAWYRKQRRNDTTVSLTVLREARPDEGDGDQLRDQPLSFAAEHRRHALRTVVTTTVEVPNPSARIASTSEAVPAHDPFAAFEEDSD
ncbi:type I-E CRISPR-associated protein Cas5/CasD [Streptomyces sp. SP17KL33]|uniref:type I-E CRISPR-associated protein Cas5/CasD n=1 Tax=Streptomyces sp. SP17KL33 TaxID=3002534 RepID=UPI002E7836FA|nr:type I-E CRISPR-associated protein Cas5/CasD [Streptomyces sp. SP17KL33]MEE1829733.1 type I-E CRISPR-associated protein Cas5/CasD [Streptomyces sp. SP17KL33]